MRRACLQAKFRLISGRFSLVSRVNNDLTGRYLFDGRRLARFIHFLTPVKHRTATHLAENTQATLLPFRSFQVD